jgi:predicted nucleotidyltransferase
VADQTRIHIGNSGASISGMGHGLDPVDPERLAALCRRHHIVRLELFGSRAKGTARPDSDIDLLATFEAGHTPGLEFFGLADEFAALLGHPVDLFTRESVEGSPNPYKRASILAAAEAIYDAAA